MGRQNKENKVRKKYRLALTEENSLKTVKQIRFSKFWGITGLVGILLLLIALIYSLIAFTPIKVTIPGYPDAKFRQTAVNNTIKVDSLERVITKWSIYADNLSRVLIGEETVPLDSIIGGRATSFFTDMTEEKMHLQDSILRALVAEDERGNLSSNAEHTFSAQTRRFYMPIKGIIVESFDAAFHPGVDISAVKDDVVMSVLDGTVIFSGWTDESGYIIAVQHSDDLTSIYKNNSKLLKSVGDKVSGGTPIAFAGNTGMQTETTKLHFELWDRGSAVDPEKYINFQ